MRKLGGLLGLVVLASLMPATAEGKLTGPERRALDISGVTGASTSSAMLAEIRFAGNVEERLGRGALRKAQVKVELMTASGQTTVITDRGTDRRPRRSRTGTVGSFQMLRDEGSILLLVEGLTEPVRQATVSTSTGAARAAQDGQPSDQVIVPIPGLEFQQAMKAERERVQREIERLEAHMRVLEQVKNETVDEVHDSQQQLNRAESREEAAKARKQLEFSKAALERLTDALGEIRMELKALRRWQEIIGKPQIIVIIPL